MSAKIHYILIKMNVNIYKIASTKIYMIEPVFGFGGEVFVQYLATGFQVSEIVTLLLIT